MRILYYVPMIHSDKELNDVGSVLKDLRIKVYGEQAVKHDELQIDRLWQYIHSWVLKTVRDARGLIIYQDGMPVGSREKIRELFRHIIADHSQSPLFRLTQELLDAGAVLEGTEDMNLVIRRAAIYRKISEAATKCLDLKEIEHFLVEKGKEQDDLIVQADRFIARRIDETLPEGGRGILFMGHYHKVDEELVRMRNEGSLSHPIEIHKLKLSMIKHPSL